VHSSKDFIPTNPIRTKYSDPTNVSKKKNVSQPQISKDSSKFSNNFSQTHHHKPNKCSSQCCTHSTQSKRFFIKTCFHCGKIGHIRNFCWKLFGKHNCSPDVTNNSLRNRPQGVQQSKYSSHHKPVIRTRPRVGLQVYANQRKTFSDQANSSLNETTNFSEQVDNFSMGNIISKSFRIFSSNFKKFWVLKKIENGEQVELSNQFSVLTPNEEISEIVEDVENMESNSVEPKFPVTWVSLFK